MQDDPRHVFRIWLSRRAGHQVSDEELEANDGNLDRYVARHGLPTRILSEPEIRVAAYDGRFVGEVRGTGSVLVCEARVQE